ncbi:hypothetical protein CYLTODRAFT_70098 [Cylindrobasidium torrendii FP15055 ss-10]|uniref:Uncharacterized protein n=1 Tax=Cylindrobasidium torrendii FP15055 ss-10 TaxID=1314674 RepID=A0A0D7BPB1_9AGAR|nr:hypothetical protein CYLTODRAFT_70098 [Cylindrobasidium torrendii FP15055 ss-10]
MSSRNALCNLPKVAHSAPLPLFRQVRPGSVNVTHYPGVRVDPSHPACKVPVRRLPTHSSDLLFWKALPSNALNVPQTARSFQRTVEAWTQRIARSQVGGILLPPLVCNKGDPRRIPVSFALSTNKATIHKRAVIRQKFSGRVKAALALILQRGASEQDGDLVLKDEVTVEEAYTLMRPGWQYIAWPRFDMFAVPYPALVKDLRHSLETLASDIDQWEAVWARSAGLKPPNTVVPDTDHVPTHRAFRGHRTYDEYKQLVKESLRAETTVPLTEAALRNSNGRTLSLPPKTGKQNSTSPAAPPPHSFTGSSLVRRERASNLAQGMSASSRPYSTVATPRDSHSLWSRGLRGYSFSTAASVNQSPKRFSLPFNSSPIIDASAVNRRRPIHSNMEMLLRRGGDKPVPALPASHPWVERLLKGEQLTAFDAHDAVC